jgi:hypothetical protein
MPCMVVRGNTPRRREEYYHLPSPWTLGHRFDGTVMLLLLSCFVGSSFLDVVLNFCLYNH